MSASKKKKVERTSAARPKASAKNGAGRSTLSRGDDGARVRAVASGKPEKAELEKLDTKSAVEEFRMRADHATEAPRAGGENGAVPSGSVKGREVAPAPRGTPPALPIPLATFTV
jgi:hypothetical protein